MEQKTDAPPLRIRALRVENYKRIQIVDLHPDGATVVLGGRNAQGKSSVLDAIADALGGKRKGAGTVLPLRTGTLAGKVVVDLGAFRVTRAWTPQSDRLTVEDPSGKVFKSPQALLDGMLGDVSFDPLAFARMPPAQQAGALRRLVGLDTAALDDRRAALYRERTAVNAELRQAVARASVEPLGPPPTVPDPVDVTGLLAAQRRALDLEREADKARRELAAIEQEAVDRSADLDHVRHQVAHLEATAAARDRTREDLEAALRSTTAAAEKAPGGPEALRAVILGARDAVAHAIRKAEDFADSAANELPEIRALVTDAVKAVQDACRAAERARESLAKLDQQVQDAKTTAAAAALQLSEAQQTNAARDAALQQRAGWEAEHRRRAGLTDDVQRATKRSEDLTAQIAQVDAEKASALGAARFPVDGLGIDGDQVTFRGLPLDQASQAERLRVCVAVAAALSPQIQIALIRDGAVLDDQSLADLVATCEAAGLQAWIEVVGDRNGVGVIIEDGRAGIVGPPLEA